MTTVVPHTETEMAELQMKQVSEEADKSQDQDSVKNFESVVLNLNEDEIQEQSPPLTYVDFLPKCLGYKFEGCEPTYAEFQSVVEQANQWLRSMPQFSAVKCETVDHTLNPTNYSLDADLTLQQFSSRVKNVYLRGLRLWLMPKTDASTPTQQLAYITVLPDHPSGSITSALSNVKPATMRYNPMQAFHEVFHDLDSLPVAVEKLNKHLQQKPLPGRILTIETVPFKAMESDRSDRLDTECCLWTKNAKFSRIFLSATRIFYVVGQPAFEKIGYYDEIPECIYNPEAKGLRIHFASSSDIVSRAAVWLTEQRNLRAVNFQTVLLKLERRAGGVGASFFKVDATTAGYAESHLLEEPRYVKILRIFYVRDQRAEALALYSSVKLSARLFVPTKTVGGEFETFSRTMHRVIAWLNATGTPVLGMETVKYPVKLDSESGMNTELVVSLALPGRYSLTCVRLFFPCHFKEPLPEMAEDAWRWGCVVL